MVMHARKPQRVNDGYFEKHQAHPYQSSKYSKRDYDREASRSAFARERDISPGPINGNYKSNSFVGNNSYRSVSPDLDSPRGDKDRDRERERDRYQSTSYAQKMREKNDRDRDSSSSYKKDKYGSDCLRSPNRDKRDRRDRDTDHRTNHDRIEMNRRGSSKMLSDKQRGGSSSNSDDRDRDRDRERDRGGGGGVGGDRGERVTRIGDWSEHLSSSGKKYYYNCKTEVSQWEKPREWLEKERFSKELHREYRERDRDRDRERDDRFSSRSSYGKHSSSRGSSRIRWQQDADLPPSSSSHRRRHEVDSQDMDISPGDSTPTSEASYSHSSTPTTMQNDGGPGGPPVLLPTALPRLSSHPSTPTNSQLHFQTPSSVGGLNTNSTSLSQQQQQHHQMMMGRSTDVIGDRIGDRDRGPHPMSKLGKNDGSLHTASLPASSPGGAVHLGGNHQNVGPGDNMLNSNTPGPPSSGGGGNVTLASLPKLLSQITGNKQMEQNEINPQKALQTINNALMMSNNSGLNRVPLKTQQQGGSNENNHSNSGSNSLREHTLNSPLYNISHLHSMSLNHHSGNSPYVTGGGGNNSSSMMISDGPPTPTQELDVNDHRKLDGTSASLSSLQGVSSQGPRSQGPSLTPSLANYIRTDLIAHVTGWPADILEKQSFKCSDESHIYGDLQCTRVSAELKIARSLVRITEITATLQEQKVMYLRQQIRRLEELKSQNSFMSDDL